MDKKFAGLKEHFILPLVLASGALVVRGIFFLGGARGSDAYVYAKHAYEIATGSYRLDTIASFYGFRYTVLLPTALSYRLFGVSDGASTFFLYLCSALNVLIVYHLVRKLLDKPTAILASLLVLFYPLDVLFANMISPDSFIPVLSASAIFCYLRAEEKNDNKFFAGVGFFIGLAYLARITSIFLLGAVVLYHLFYRKTFRPLFYITGGFALPWMAEAIYYLLRTKDPFFHLNRLAVNDHLVKGPQPEAIVSLLFYPKAMFGLELTGLATYGFFWWLVLGGLIVAWWRRDRRLILPSICLFIPFLGFEFGWQNLKEMTPIMKNYGYLSLLTCPAAILAAYFLRHLYSHLLSRGKRAVSVFLALCIFLVGSSLYGIHRLAENVRDDAGPYLAVAEFMKSKGKGVIYVHHERWPLFLEYFLRYSPSWEFKRSDKISIKELEEVKEGYFVLHKRYLEADTAGRLFREKSPLQVLWDSPPVHWQRVLYYPGRPPYNTVILYEVDRYQDPER